MILATGRVVIPMERQRRRDLGTEYACPVPEIAPVAKAAIGMT